MIRRPPRSTLFPTRRSSDLIKERFNHDYHSCHDQGAARAVRRRIRRREECAHRSEWRQDRKSTRLNSSHSQISYAVFCLKKKKKKKKETTTTTNTTKKHKAH